MSESAPPPTNSGSTKSPPPAASTKTPPPLGEPDTSNFPPPSSSPPPPAPPAWTPPPAFKAPPPAAEPPPSPPSPSPSSDTERSSPPPIPTSSTPPPSPPAQPAIPVPPPPLVIRTPPPPSAPAVLPLPPPASPSGANASPLPPAIAVPTPPTVPIETPTVPSSIPAPPPPAASLVTPPSSPNNIPPSNPIPEPPNSNATRIPATSVPENAGASPNAPSSSNLAPITPSSQSSPPESSRDSSGTGVAVGLAAIAAVAIAVIVFLLLKQKRRSGDISKGYKHPLNGFSPKNRKRGSAHPAVAAAPNTVEKTYGIYVDDVLDHSGSKPLFTYEELTSITNGFSPNNVIGEGGFGAVYKGVLPDGRQVAVKQLKPGSGQGEREFRAEVEIISRIHHRHLVSLVGYCTERHRLLVYEFVANNTLDHHLHGKGLPVLDWSKRMRIAIGSARGLAYLHEDCNPRIIHRDIKSANILLDESLEAKVADFGLAKLTNDTSTHISTRVMGTFGYLAPEYAFSGKLTDKSDVYSFGVVLLELITGRKPVDQSLPSGDGSLVEWARPLLVQALETGECEHFVDPRLENNYVKMDMLRAIEVATACVRHSAPKRPRMMQVLRALDSGGSMPDLSNGVKFGESTVYDSSQYSADIQQLRRMAFERDTFTIDFESSGAQGHAGSSTAYSTGNGR